MTGEEVRDYIVRKFKRTDKDTEIYEAITDIVADMRLRIMSDNYSEEAYIAGIDTLGDYRIAVPTDMGHFIGNISVTETGDDKSYPDLIKISKNRYDELYVKRLLTTVANRGSDTPKHFCIYGQQIFIGPVPDKTTYVYQINFTTEAFTAVTSATTDVPFSTRYRNTIRSGVMRELHNGLENYEESMFWDNLYLNELVKILDNDRENKADDEGMEYSGF